MSHLMTCPACGDASNCTWTDLPMPTLAGVNCAKHSYYITLTLEDSIKMTNPVKRTDITTPNEASTALKSRG